MSIYNGISIGLDDESNSRRTSILDQQISKLKRPKASLGLTLNKPKLLPKKKPANLKLFPSKTRRLF